MRQENDSWKQLIFYGEVVGFALAWVVGVAMLLHTQTPEPRLANVDGLAHAEIGMSDTGLEQLK